MIRHTIYIYFLNFVILKDTNVFIVMIILKVFDNPKL